MDHDHVPALSALLLSAPLAVLALAAVQVAAHRWTAPRVAVERAGTTSLAGRLAAILLLVAGAIHIGLVAGHLDEPKLAAAFAVAGVGLIGLAAATLLRLPHWRFLGATALLSVLGTYSAYCVAGVQGLDVLGLTTAAIELVALWILLSRPALGAAPVAVRQ